MKRKSRLIEVTTSVWRKKTTLVLEFDEVLETKKWEDKTLSVDIDIWREKRSLSANAYFHVLVEKLAVKNGVSNTHQKNELISRYGKALYLNGDVAVVNSNIPPENICEIPSPHFKFIRFDGNQYHYEIYRGSHTYDSKEMSELIEGTIAEAQDAGIETMTPDEISRLTAIWKPKEGVF